MKIKMSAIIILCALFLGAVAGMYGGLAALALVGLVAFSALLILDYRFGVVSLMIVIPYLGLNNQGANVLMLLTTLTFAVYFFRKLFKRERVIGLPRVVWLGMIITVAWGAFLAAQHLDEAQAALSDTDLASMYSVRGFLIIDVLMPFGMIAFAWLLANAVRDSKKPELFLVAIALISSSVALQILHFVVTSGYSVDVLGDARHREVFSQLGHHANAFGPMLAVASAPFLFLTADSKGWARIFYGTVLLAVVAGCALVFSRGGYLAFVVVFGAFLVMRRSVKVIVGVVLVGGVLLIAAPEAVLDRATTGLDSRSLDMAASRSAEDPLTAGRLSVYDMFAPEIANSPIWGSGTGSAAWSAAVRNGVTTYLHPHNTYLRALMDVGAVGVLLLGYFWYGAARRMRALSLSPSVSPVMRSYFSGAFAGVLGYLAACISGGPHWLPDAGQMFLWCSVGLTLAYWPEHASRRERAEPPGRATMNTRPVRSASPERWWKA